MSIPIAISRQYECRQWVASRLSKAYHANGSYRMRSRRQTTIFPNQNLIDRCCAHSSRSIASKNYTAKGGSRPRADSNCVLANHQIPYVPPTRNIFAGKPKPIKALNDYVIQHANSFVIVTIVANRFVI